MKIRRQSKHIAIAVSTILLATLVLTSRADADAGYDPAKTYVTLGQFTAGPNGTVTGDGTLPDGTPSDFELIATGVGPDGQPLTKFATVTGGGSAAGASTSLETAAGSVRIQLAAAIQIHFTVDGFKPGSVVSVSARFTPAAPVAGGPITRSALPLTGSDVGLLLAIAVALMLLGAALVGSVRRRLYSVPD